MQGKKNPSKILLRIYFKGFGCCCCCCSLIKLPIFFLYWKCITQTWKKDQPLSAFKSFFVDVSACVSDRARVRVLDKTERCRWKPLWVFYERIWAELCLHFCVDVNVWCVCVWVFDQLEITVFLFEFYAICIVFVSIGSLFYFVLMNFFLPFYLTALRNWLFWS